MAISGSADVSVGRFHGLSIGHFFWAAADAAGQVSDLPFACPRRGCTEARGSRDGRRPSQRDALAPLTREGWAIRRRGPDLHARMGTQSRCSEIDPRKRHKSRTTAATWSRRTGRSYGSWSATTATTPRANCAAQQNLGTAVTADELLPAPAEAQPRISWICATPYTLLSS